MGVATILAITSVTLIFSALADVLSEIFRLSSAERAFLAFLARDEGTRLEIQVRLTKIFNPLEGRGSKVDSGQVDEAIAYLGDRLQEAEFPQSLRYTLMGALNQPCERSRVSYLKKTYNSVRGKFGDLVPVRA